MIILIISAVAVNASVFALTYTYFSHFTKTKWERNEQVRIYMINDLESKHEIIGKSEQEIIDLLGKPSNVAEYGLKTYEYYIGDDLIDPYTYNIGFENGIAKYANISQH
ncbi:MAG: hypothetical protein Q4G33_06885 [bacterium]|nr:hypothetical protein [bacterium]